MKKILSLIFLFIIVGIVSALYINNPTVVTVNLFSSTYNAPMALVLLITFGAGIFIASLVCTVLISIKNIRIWQITSKTKIHNQHMNELISIREEIASGDVAQAELKLRKIIDKEDNLHALILLVESLISRNQLNEAITVLEHGRVILPSNVEILFKLSELYKTLGNVTASADNLRIINNLDPANHQGKRLLFDDLIKLGKHEEAEEVIKNLMRISTADEIKLLQTKFAKIQLEKINSEFSLDKITDFSSVRKKLEDFLVRHRDYPQAHLKLAEIEVRDGKKLDLAKKFFQKAVDQKLSAKRTVSFFEVLLRSNLPEFAIELVKSAIQQIDKRGSSSYDYKALLSIIFIRLEDYSSAQKYIELLQSEKNTAFSKLLGSLIELNFGGKLSSESLVDAATTSINEDHLQLIKLLKPSNRQKVLVGDQVSGHDFKLSVP